MDDKRTRILEAAREVCALVGFEAARMEEIAGAARVSKGTLYRFFESKEDLLLAGLIDSHLAESYPGPGARDPAGTDAGLRLETLLEEQARVLTEASARMLLNMQAWGLVAGDAGRRERLCAVLRERVYRLRTEEVAAALSAGIAAGVYRPGTDVARFAGAVLALFDGTLYRSVFDPDHAGPEELRAGFRLLLDAIRLDGRA